MDLFDIEEATANSDLVKKNNSIKRIKELEKLIKKHQDLYYNGEPEISDGEFDKLWDELKASDPANPILHKVGSDSGNFDKAPHIMPMGSQEKAATPEEFYDWCEKHQYDEYFVEYKLDGASLELQYSHGHLLRAVTRGNGSVGDVITDNAVKMHGVVRDLYDDHGNLIDFSGAFRGEVIMTHNVHKTLYSDKANCRNAANGLMKKKDGQGSENLTFISYDAWTSSDDSFFSDEEQKLNFISSCGFNVVPLKICNSSKAVVDYRAEVMGLRKKLDYDIDGLVVKERTINKTDASRDRPDRQIAFKFSLEEAVSVLRSVEWNENGATYTPVAVFDPVDLNGTTVKRASLVNTNLISALGIKIGSKVVVVKRGEIIPKIVSALPADNYSDMIDIIPPSKCSVCGSPLIDEGTRLYCPEKKCKKRVLHQLLKWVSVVDIRDLGETLVSELFSSEKVRSISDFYKLNEEILTPFFLNSESLKDEKKSLGAEKVYNSIQGKRKMSLAKFVAGFDIEGVGETVVQLLVDAGFNTLEKLLKASVEEIAGVYRFAEVSARTLVDGLKENKDEMLYLIQDGIILLDSVSENGILSGKSFCFTGELVTMKRSDAQNKVKALGGAVKSSVVKGLSYLVTNDVSSGSSKNKKAAELGIPVISEKQFLELLQSQN